MLVPGHERDFAGATLEEVIAGDNSEAGGTAPNGISLAI